MATPTATTFVTDSYGLDGVVSVAFDGSGNLYVAAQVGGKVLKVSPAGVVTTVGVPHEGNSSRSVFQTVSPVSASSASRNESACVSHCMITSPFQMIGELAGPHS